MRPMRLPDMSADKVMAGLKGSAGRLCADGHEARILRTKDADTVGDQVEKALAQATYDVIVIGAGLRTLPAMADQFEKFLNILHCQRLAFNSRPDDSDVAARRWLR